MNLDDNLEAIARDPEAMKKQHLDHDRAYLARVNDTDRRLTLVTRNLEIELDSSKRLERNSTAHKRP